jgi:hypothetical protein
MRQLTPSELTFQSFRHSQGDAGAQMRLFRIADIDYGIEPDLHPSEEDSARYIGYLTGAADRQLHLDITQGSEPIPAPEAATDAFEKLRGYMDEDLGRDLASASRLAIITEFADSILHQEIRILDQLRPWLAHTDDLPHGRDKRTPARVQSGKSSYMYLYGRDGQSTGFAELDAIYRESWNAVEKGWGYLYVTGPEHAESVRAAEIAYLGHTVLGREMATLT